MGWEPASEEPQVAHSLGFGCIWEAEVRVAPKNVRHLPLSWIKQYIVSKMVSIAMIVPQNSSRVATLPALGASLCCSGGCLSLCLMRCGGRGLAWEWQCCVAPTLHVLALFLLTGLQPVLLQEGLPPLRSGEYQCLPSGNPAGCGEEKRCLQEAFQPSLTAMCTASSSVALGWFGQGSDWELCIWPSLNCGVPGALGTQEVAKTEARQREWIQLQLQNWPLVE